VSDTATLATLCEECGESPQETTIENRLGQEKSVCYGCASEHAQNLLERSEQHRKDVLDA